jgi:hypothetical protein
MTGSTCNHKQESTRSVRPLRSIDRQIGKSDEHDRNPR